MEVLFKIFLENVVREFYGKYYFSVLSMIIFFPVSSYSLFVNIFIEVLCQVLLETTCITDFWPIVIRKFDQILCQFLSHSFLMLFVLLLFQIAYCHFVECA